MSNLEKILELPLRDISFFHARLNSSLNILENKINFLIGDNGVGKTSLFEYLKIHQKQLFPFDIAFISQAQLSCFPGMRGVDLKIVLQKSLPDRFSAWVFEQIIKIMDPSLRILNTEIQKLSGGQKQIFKLAMGLCLSSELYIIDEPFNNLDKVKRDKLRDFFLKLNQEMGKGFLITDHFYQEWSKQADQKIKMKLNHLNNQLIDFEVMK